jgi:periplasmic protein TonB
MLDTLLESRVKAKRSAGSTVASVAAHTAFIAGALYATAQAHVELGKSTEVVRQVYFPMQTAQSATRASTAHRASQLREWKFVVHPIDIVVPPVDVIVPTSEPGDFTPNSTLASRANGSGLVRNGGDEGGAFRADQVDKQVALLPGSNTPRYPELLRSAGIEGQVVALFVVDEQGRVDEKSIRFTPSGNHLFEDSVRTALGRMRFVPAEAGGRKVSQLVEMPFVFTLSR